MEIVEIRLPKLGESIQSATILTLLKKAGDAIHEDETIAEVATDKVDAEVPCAINGILEEWLVAENEEIEIGKPIARVRVGKETTLNSPPNKNTDVVSKQKSKSSVLSQTIIPRTDGDGNFFSPLVRSIAQNEGISLQTLTQIKGSGSKGRLLKKDIVSYLKNGHPSQASTPKTFIFTQTKASTSSNGNVEIVAMDRMRTMIAQHMVHSKQTAPHVTAYVEVDMTKIVNWRNKVKHAFFEKHGEKITFTPIFLDAMVKAIQDYPGVNASVDGNNIIYKKEINIGVAAALPTGNLIVPVVKNADEKNIVGLAKQVNQLVGKARSNNLKADDIQGGTITLSNVGTFRNLMGTPIINQPEVAILAAGMIKKRAVVLEKEEGDVIAIRSMMYLSLSFDHRIVDGQLGGSFLARIGDYLEAFEPPVSI